MPKIKYLGEEARTLPWEGGRLVEPGQVIEVADAEPYTCQSIWEPVGAKSAKAEKE